MVGKDEEVLREAQQLGERFGVRFVASVSKGEAWFDIIDGRNGLTAANGELELGSTRPTGT